MITAVVAFYKTEVIIVKVVTSAMFIIIIIIVIRVFQEEARRSPRIRVVTALSFPDSEYDQFAFFSFSFVSNTLSSEEPMWYMVDS